MARLRLNIRRKGGESAAPLGRGFLADHASCTLQHTQKLFSSLRRSSLMAVRLRSSKASSASVAGSKVPHVANLVGHHDDGVERNLLFLVPILQS